VTSRVQAIVALLERYDDLVDPWREGTGGMGVPMMPPTYTSDVRELERLLRRMRDELKPLWWHLNEHFLAVTWVQKTVFVQRKTKHGKRLTIAERRMERLGDRSDERRVAEGVAWLAEEWALGHEPMVPELALV
jgi:hypothetical protein